MESNNSQASGYITYPSRWFVLAAVMIFNISNAMIWITYASVVNFAAVYYEVSEERINWFSLVFFVFFVLAGLPAFWLIDTFGLRVGMLTGTWMNAIGCIIRLLPSFISGINIRFWVALIGQAVAACSQPIILAIPTKLAALWFADNERTVANTLASLSNPVGVLIASGLAPIIVNEPYKIKLMLILFSIPAFIAVLMVTFGVCTSAPPTAPSSSAHEISKSFFIGIKEALRSRTFLILMIIFGFGVGAFSTITSLLEQIICAKGYDNDISGLCGALVIVGGLVFSGIAGVYVDKTKKFEETAKLLIMLAVVASSLVLISSNLYDQTAVLCISFFLFGATCLGTAPILLELGVECTYPVDESTSSGLQWFFGQVVGIILMLGMPAVGRPLTAKEKEKSACNVAGSVHAKIEAKDLSIPLIVVTVLLFFFVLLFVFLFKADYKRLNAETEAKMAKRFYDDTQELDQAADDFINS